jgi:hypothetical protein
VPGLDEGLLTMATGGVRRLYIPGDLAFPKGLPAGGTSSRGTRIAHCTSHRHIAWLQFVRRMVVEGLAGLTRGLRAQADACVALVVCLGALLCSLMFSLCAWQSVHLSLFGVST